MQTRFFIGLPLNIALFGDDALAYFLIYYITNTISTWTLGVFLMTSDSKDRKRKNKNRILIGRDYFQLHYLGLLFL